MVAEALIQLAVRFNLRFLCLQRAQKSKHVKRNAVFSRNSSKSLLFGVEGGFGR